MLYKYDEAIAKNLEDSFDVSSRITPFVKVIDEEGETMQDIVAQMKNDEIEFPIIILSRNPDTPVDTTRTNFTRMHRGVAAVMNIETNELYYEKVVPIKLGYQLLVLATNTADIDEIVRELTFKYISMFFVGFELPYESRRKVRFGVELDLDSEIARRSSSKEYIASGQLHQAIVPLKCQGAVMLSYTPAKLQRTSSGSDIEIIEP